VNSRDKYEHGYHGGGSRLFDPDVDTGRRDAERHRAIAEQAAAGTRSLAETLAGSSARGTAANRGAGIDSWQDAAKVFAGLCFMLALLVWLLTSNTMGLGQFALAGALAAGAGAVLGMALYVAVKGLAMALKWGAALLGIGVALDWLGWIELMPILRSLFA
jgi:hypothetical protein